MARETSSLPAMKALATVCLFWACGVAAAEPPAVAASAPPADNGVPLQLDLPRALFFERDGYRLTAEHRRLLARHAQNLRADRRLRLIVHAHGDNHGAPDYNQALADKRAETVIKVLVTLGVEPYQLEARALARSRAKVRHVELVYR
jgi:outer membrane protein OmpA-like peptidoglycan-associated protein